MAEGHKLAKEITDQFLHCKICFEPFKEPKTLVCLHTFCSDCIQKHVDSDTNRSSRFLVYSRYITCPLCRNKTEIPSGGIRKLPDNFMLSSLTDVLDRKRVGNIPSCEICKGERPRAGNHASHKCLDCDKLLCKSCVDLHMTTRVTQHHSLIDIAGEKNIECKTHPEESVRYYCEPCEECVCIVCTFQEHRDHDICSFNDGFSKYRSSLDSLLEKCKDRISNVQNRLSTITNIESALKETRENIRDLAISYIAQVRTTERQLAQRVDEEFGLKVQGFVQNKEWLQENLEGLQTTCNVAEVILNDNGIEMFLLKRELQNKLSTLLEPALPTVPETLSQNIKFVPGNVQFGHISINSDDDVDCDGGSVKKQTIDIERGKHCKQVYESRDTQTENGSNPAPVAVGQTPKIPNGLCVAPSSLLPNGLSHDEINVKSKNSTNDYISKTDVSVNTMFSMDDTWTGVCVQCCAELKTYSVPLSQIPIIDGSAPVIQDIIITHCSDGDKHRRRRRRTLIKSRRVQTDISLLNENLDGVLSPRVSSQQSPNGTFRKHSSQRPLVAVVECVITTSIGVDPIDFGLEENHKVVTANKYVNTTENIKPITESRSVKINTMALELCESATMTTASGKTVETQTVNKIAVENKCIATDYIGQRNKRTSTPIIITMDNGTHMAPQRHETKVTWTDSLQTTERSICTESSQAVETSTETKRIESRDQCLTAVPVMKAIETLTEPVLFAKTNSVKPNDKKAKSKEKKEKSKDKKIKEKKESKLKKEYADSCVETDQTKTIDKKSGTIILQFRESWTTTESPHMVHTGISPVWPAARDVCIETNPMMLVEQATYTDVIKLQESASEAVTLMFDGETLTERIGLQDAQTNVDLFFQNAETFTDGSDVTNTGCMTDSEWFLDDKNCEFNTEPCEVCQERNVIVGISTSSQAVSNLEKHVVNIETQTVDIQLYDKAVYTSREFAVKEITLKGAAYNDMSTSTENLPYIGLFSNMDCDELILVPEIAIDMIGSDAEYERIYENSFPSGVLEAGVQTMISSADPNFDNFGFSDVDRCEIETSPDLRDLIKFGADTDKKLTFEKETCTPALHRLTKATSTTFLGGQTDKATSCTGSFVKNIQENVLPSPSIERSSIDVLPIKKDICVETDPALPDERMWACINKLKTASETLSSPVSQTFDSLPWVKTSDAQDGNVENETSDAQDGNVENETSDAQDDNVENEIEETNKTAESDRKKNFMDLVAIPQAIVRPKESKSQSVLTKPQPLTTLKEKISDNSETDLQGLKSIPPLERVDQSKTLPVKIFGEVTPTQVRAANSLRNKSSPGLVATVANQLVLKKATPNTPRTNESTLDEQDNEATLPTPKQKQSPKLNSTVPNILQCRQELAVISKNRHSTIGSEVSSTSLHSTVSELSPASVSSLDMSLDVSSLKIMAPPLLTSSISSTPQRANAQEGRAAGQQSTDKPQFEVVPNIEPSEMQASAGSISSDQTDEPLHEKKGFIRKLFGSKKKKSAEKHTVSLPGKSPKLGKKTNAAIVTTKQPPEEPKEKPKDKSKPFVYMRSRIFSIEQKDDKKYSKPMVNKYCTRKDEEQIPM